jgi:hypothetical protein
LSKSGRSWDQVSFALKAKCTTGKERRIYRWEHEAVVEEVQKRLPPRAHRIGILVEPVEHPFGTIKMRMGATHFLCKTLPKVATEMALCVLTHNLTRMSHARSASNVRPHAWVAAGFRQRYAVRLSGEEVAQEAVGAFEEIVYRFHYTLDIP